MNERGILVTNLGSPVSPTEQDVKLFLNEFLMDPRVITLPWLVRRALVSLILRTRPSRVAESYKQIWTDKGSPLLVYANEVAEQLRSQLNNKVAVGMRYGKPSIEEAQEQFNQVEEILLLSPYPQYAESTTLSLYEQAKTYFKNKRILTVPPYYNDPTFIELHRSQIKNHLTSDIEHLVVSFHGIPVSHLKRADPTGNHCANDQTCCETSSRAHLTCYRHQCLKTAEAITENIELPTSVSFSSRLGRAKWLEPYTSEHLVSLASAGIKRVAVVCPSFICDNLETLYEIGIEAKEIFCQAGGIELQLIPSLNTHQDWISHLIAWSKASTDKLEIINEPDYVSAM